MKKKTLLSWSSGKDSAWALHCLRRMPEIDLIGLYTVVNKTYDRVSMHATRMDLLKRQADAAGMALEIIEIPHPCTNEECDAIMRVFVNDAEKKGVESMAFGDLFLRDIRQYREHQLQKTKIKPIFPLWNIPTEVLVERILNSGIEAYISCVDPKKVPRNLIGRRLSKELIKELPEDVDPCGENGEFHTVVVGGPMFRESIPISIGQIVEREGFLFADIIPEDKR